MSVQLSGLRSCFGQTGFFHIETAALMGLVIGAPIALGVHGAKAGTRGVSSATTLGVANPIISFFEDVIAFLVSLLALLAPLLVPLMLICLGVVGWKAVKLAKRLRARKAGVLNGQT